MAAEVWIRPPDWNSLNPVTAAFKFHPRKGTLPFNNETDLFDTTELGLVEVHDLNVPSSVFGIECIHPEEITSKKRSFLSTYSGTDFHNDILAIIWIPRQ